jgi:hypothetical protein
MDSCQLPLAEPPIRGFLRWTSTLSIVGNNERTMPWFYCNFLQVWCTKHYLENKAEMFFDFFRGNKCEAYFNNPFLETTVCNFDMLSFLDERNVIDYFTAKIEEGYYPFVFIDESRIPHSPSFNVYSFPHHILLYGFDREERTFRIMMFDRNWIYGSHLINFDEFTDAFFAMKRNVKEKGLYDQCTFFYKSDPNFEYRFDKTALVNEARDFLNSETNQNRINLNPTTEVYGLETYDYISKFYESWGRNDPSLVRRGFFRHLHILWEHKKVMTERLRFLFAHQYLEKDDILIAGYQDLTNRAEKLRNMLLMHMRRPSEGTVERICYGLMECKDREKLLMGRFLSLMEGNAGKAARTAAL